LNREEETCRTIYPI